jgi:uncharacterized membrane protein YebE (DUF533 family)
MSEGLTDKQRRWLGAAVAMAAADGVLDEREIQLVEQIGERLGLTETGRSQLREMLASPPSPVEIAAWAISAEDRHGLYQAALETARVDDEIAPREQALLDTLAMVLKLSPEETGR